MKLTSIKTAIVAIALISLSVINTATAGLITGSLNTDDQHWVYLSTDDSLQGTQISHTYGWKTTDTFSESLTAGTDYYLHVKVSNDYGPAGFVGEFNLDGSQHLFSNGLSNIVTNTTDWTVGTSGWGTYSAAVSEGQNGTTPWTSYASTIDSSAHWIWDGSVSAQETAYFTIAINAVEVPVPSTLALFGLTFLGLVSRRNKK